MPNLTDKQIIGRLGEGIAVKHLQNKGFTIIEQNYLKKCGEIDIIAKNGPILHFIEVKTVSEFANSETDKYRAEDNIHAYKLKRLARTIQVYLLEKYEKSEPVWQFDAIIVRLNMKNRNANVKFLPDIIL